MSSSWTPHPLFRGVVSHCRQSMQSAAFALCVLLLAACGQSSGSSSSSSETSVAAAPPGATNRPAPLGTTGAAKDANGLPVLAPRGVNAGQLFAEKLSNTDDRMVRLENAVQEMRNDFDAMAPAIVRLVAVEKDIQELVTQLEGIVGSGSQPAPAVESQPLATHDPSFPVPPPAGDNGADGAPLPLSNELPVMAEEMAQAESPAQPVSSPPAPAATSPPATPAPAPAAAPAPAPAPTKAAAGSSVTAIRFGEHPGKTRIVLDLSAATTYNADLDNGEKILVIDLPGASWGTAMEKTLSGSPFIASYKVNPGANGTGSLLVIKLKADAALLYKGVMKADSGTGSKIVIDIGKAPGSAVSTQ